MFKCGVCGNTSKPGERKTTLPAEVRKVTYRTISRDWESVSEGRETAREVAVCPPCLPSAPPPVVVGERSVTHVRRGKAA